MKGAIVTIADRVKNILRVSVKARNSDRELLIIYMQKSGMELTEKQMQIFRDMPSMETLRRVRQKIQEGGEYQADQSIKKERSHKAMVMQQTTPRYKGEAAVKHIEKTLGVKVMPWGQ